METELYHKLREQLDQYSVGFPATASGIEIRILQKMFTPEEARMYLDLTLMLEKPQDIAGRTGREEAPTRALLEQMVEKGLIFCLRRKGQVRYGAVPFVVGSFEFQLKRMDRELAEMIEAYMQEALLDNLAGNMTPMRTVPVHRSLNVAWQVAPHADARRILQSKEKIAVADCICRTQQKHIEAACDKPLEVCFMFGAHADYYVDRRMARYVEVDEALRILEACDAHGLVTQPANAVNPGGLCNCCGDCCGILRALRRLPNPAAMVHNNYLAVVDGATCSGCATCVDRCQMDAIQVSDDQVAQVDSMRCIGCGLCVTTCPTEALSLDLKPPEAHSEPPRTGREFMEKTAQMRGKSLIPLAMQNQL